MIISHEGPHFGPKTTAESIHLSTELDYVEVAEKVIRKMQRDFDAAVLAQCEHELASFGYVKVVRCRDCKEYRASDATCHSWQWHNWDAAIEVEPDGFCAWAKRKEDGIDEPDTIRNELEDNGMLGGDA